MTPEEQVQANYLISLRGVVVQAAADYHRGVLDYQTYQAVLATVMLISRGVESPTDEQIAETVAEMRTAQAFISAGFPKPELPATDGKGAP